MNVVSLWVSLGPQTDCCLINQRGLVKTVIPEITMHFDEDLIVMEKWEPKKPITAIHWAGEKELFYVKRFLLILQRN